MSFGPLHPTLSQWDPTRFLNGCSHELPTSQPNFGETEFTCRVYTQTGFLERNGSKLAKCTT
jgi:hypothetical protein